MIYVYICELYILDIDYIQIYIYRYNIHTYIYREGMVVAEQGMVVADQAGMEKQYIYICICRDVYTACTCSNIQG